MSDRKVDERELGKSQVIVICIFAGIYSSTVARFSPGS